MTEPSRWQCLMYHDLLSSTASVTPDREWFAVSGDDFARQLDLIVAAGASGCSIEEAVAARGPRVAISFDDGVRSDYEIALPALAARKMTATFFVVTDRVGTPGHVSWSELREMRDAGMSIQSHTRSHPFLSELNERALRDELAGSKARIDEELGQNTSTLAYPGGDAPPRRWRHLLDECGYRVIATSRWGSNTEPRGGALRFVRRCTISGRLPDDAFTRVLRGDPWLSWRKGIREIVLGSARRALGPTRYSRWRGTVLWQRSPETPSP